MLDNQILIPDNAYVIVRDVCKAAYAFVCVCLVCVDTRCVRVGRD